MVGIMHDKFDTQQITETFKKREFVLEHSINRNDRKFTDYIKFQLVGERCSLIDQIEVGAKVKVFFNIKGRKDEKSSITRYFNNLDVWRLESISNNEMVEDEFPDMEINDSLPF